MFVEGLIDAPFAVPNLLFVVDAPGLSLDAHFSRIWPDGPFSIMSGVISMYEPPTFKIIPFSARRTNRLEALSIVTSCCASIVNASFWASISMGR
ncbi:hypothetical protein HR51_26970 [Burkholderia cepacia]|nr:hypothetical protein HR51_26970 [Burkholderia cepacia]